MSFVAKVCRDPKASSFYPGVLRDRGPHGAILLRSLFGVQRVRLKGLESPVSLSGVPVTHPQCRQGGTWGGGQEEAVLCLWPLPQICSSQQASPGERRGVAGRGRGVSVARASGTGKGGRAWGGTKEKRLRGKTTGGFLASAGPQRALKVGARCAGQLGWACCWTPHLEVRFRAPQLQQRKAPPCRHPSEGSTVACGLDCEAGQDAFLSRFH